MAVLRAMLDALEAQGRPFRREPQLDFGSPMERTSLSERIWLAEVRCRARTWWRSSAAYGLLALLRMGCPLHACAIRVRACLLPCTPASGADIPAETRIPQPPVCPFPDAALLEDIWRSLRDVRFGFGDEFAPNLRVVFRRLVDQTLAIPSVAAHARAGNARRVAQFLFASQHRFLVRSRFNLWLSSDVLQPLFDIWFATHARTVLGHDSLLISGDVCNDCGERVSRERNSPTVDEPSFAAHGHQDLDVVGSLWRSWTSFARAVHPSSTNLTELVWQVTCVRGCAPLMPDKPGCESLRRRGLWTELTERRRALRSQCGRLLSGPGRRVVKRPGASCVVPQRCRTH